MKRTIFQKRTAYVMMGGVGLFVSAGYLGMSFQLSFGHMDQPGAAVFPVLVGITLLLASLITMWEGWQMDKAVQVDLPAGTDIKRLVSLIGSLLIYFLMLPWLGQIISGTLFSALLMRLLWELGWLRTLAYSLAMSLILYFVFVFLLKVPMPSGIFVF